MSRFITELEVRRRYDGSTDRRGTWVLLSPLVYASDLLGDTITVPTGFVTDFASVPRIPVAFLLTADCAHESATVHDFLYTTHKVSRSAADSVFHEAALAGGLPAWQAWLMWVGVRIGGAGPYESAGQRQTERVQSLIKQQAPS